MSFYKFLPSSTLHFQFNNKFQGQNNVNEEGARRKIRRGHTRLGIKIKKLEKAFGKIVEMLLKLHRVP